MQYRISVKIEWHEVRVDGGADPLVRAGRPRPAAGATMSASCRARAGRRGRRPRTRGAAPPLKTKELQWCGRDLRILGIALSDRGPVGRALLPVSAKPLAEIVACKYLIPHVAGDGAGLLPTQPPDALHEGHPLLDSRGTESGHHAGDFGRPNRRAIAHLVDQAKFARFGGAADPPGEGKLQRAPLAQGTGDRPVNQEGPQPEVDFGEAETGFRTGHHDVAVGHQPDAAPEGRTLDTGDERLGEARAGGEERAAGGVDLSQTT